MTIHEYIESVARRYALGNSTEHTFRGDLQRLIEAMMPEVQATNEPQRILCGAPDYVITKNEVPIGYIEAKNVGVDLGAASLKEQRDRYRSALENLIYTDYLEFRLFVNGDLAQTIKIAEVRNGKVTPLPENFDYFAAMIKEFCTRRTQTIKSSKTLAEMMADKAKLLAFVIKNALDSDEESQANSTLKEQLAAFKQILIHDIDEKQFADVYAQTIAYGMFAARFHDRDLETFSRQEAAEKIPKTNPFLRKLFQYIAGYDLDDRIKWIVDALADVFRAANVRSILRNFGKSTQTHDPIMHFYETFLAEYDPKLRKARGVYYTPEPVVDFIVRVVDDILKTEFGLPAGLADTSKVKVKVDQQGKKVEKEFHKVQILDPATGTGTFLAQVIKQIHKSFENQQGIWNQYVDEHLIPRLNGFELLMASYAMAHLKLDLLLNELSGESFTPKERTKRFQIYLTNALEEYHPDTGTLWSSWLSAEANEANHIKRDTPVMVVIGNPPYAVSSSNKSVNEAGKKTWIGTLLDDYKGDLKEKKINLDDDYIKFIRFGQNLVDKNNHGILAFITNNSFVNGITHRRMRQKLLEGFDRIYVLDLHGNSKQKETAPDGSVDKNVFDITQGVSISVFVKTGAKKQNALAETFHFDLYGTRDFKYRTLTSSTLRSVPFEAVAPQHPNYFFFPIGIGDKNEYEIGFYLKDLFVTHGSGVKTDRDKLFIDFDSDELNLRFQKLLSGSYDSRFANEFGVHDSGSYKITKKLVGRKYSVSSTQKVSYRPFDIRSIYYDPEIVSRPGRDSCFHMLAGENWGLLCGRQNKADNISHYFITKLMSEMKTSEATIGSYHFPLYLYPDSKQHTLDGKQERVPNLKMEIVDKIADSLGLEFKGGNPSGSEGVSSAITTNASEIHTLPTGRVSASHFTPLDLLDYIYAFLHSPTYREKYKEFLKIDFPRVPYPTDKEQFWRLVELGGELRQIHLLESPRVSQFITGYPVGGDNVVEKPIFSKSDGLSRSTPKGVTLTGNVFINHTQYFSGVPEIAWNFYIGGYQPAQKWLKDRKGRTLTFDDIQHYQKIIVALTETDRIMKRLS